MFRWGAWIFLRREVLTLFSSSPAYPNEVDEGVEAFGAGSFQTEGLADPQAESSVREALGEKRQW